MLYDCARYEWRGKFSESRFKRECLSEYAQVFKTVCVDAAYYTFPSQQYLEGMVAQVPEDFGRWNGLFRLVARIRVPGLRPHQKLASFCLSTPSEPNSAIRVFRIQAPVEQCYIKMDP